MKELLNNIRITGKLIEKESKEIIIKNGDRAGEEALSLNLILRTADDSEHEVKFFAYKYTRDENKQTTNELNYFYEQYMDVIDNFKDIKQCAEGENPDIISITDGKFSDNDFKSSKTSDVISTNEIRAKFINRVEPKDYDSTVLEAKFEVEGIVASIKDEMVKNTPTGNLEVKLNAIGQHADGFGKDAKYEANKFIPIKMIVDKGMADGFKKAGYYDTCFAKFVGTIINTAEVTEIIEKAAFGDDIKKKATKHIRRNEIKSGTKPSTIFEHELTQDIVDALKSKRKAKLAEVKAGFASDSNEGSAFTPDTNTAPQTNYNPFASN